MKRIPPLLIVLSFFITQAKAQTSGTGNTEAGRLLVQLADHIKPENFTETWLLKRKPWTEAAAKVSTAKALVQNALMLSTYINPQQFKSTFNQKDFAKAVNKAKTYPEASRVLQSLEEGCKPGTFVGLWNNRRGPWLNALLKLK